MIKWFVTVQSGRELQGKNVKFHTRTKKSCWVLENHYDVYEAPIYGNEYKVEGKYFFGAHNTDYDYWIFGLMEYRIDKKMSASKMTVVDKAEFLPYGSYDIGVEHGKHIIRKKTLGKNTYFSSIDLVGTFDKLSSRKRAYKTSTARILGRMIGIKSDVTTVKGGEKVKVYNKNKKKPSNRKFSNKPKNYSHSNKHNFKCKKH